MVSVNSISEIEYDKTRDASLQSEELMADANWTWHDLVISCRLVLESRFDRPQ